MLRCRGSLLMRVLLKEIPWVKVKTTTGKVKQEIKSSADFQIFSYKIPWQIRTKRYLDKVAELSNQLITSSTLALLVTRSIPRESASQHIISRAMISFHLITATITTQSHQVVALMVIKEDHPKMLVKTKMEEYFSKIHSLQG